MIEATKIEIQRWEGLHEECEKTHTLTGENIWKQANELLSRMSRTAPVGGSYDKTGFKVIYSDGNTYEGRLELHGDETPNLQNHMRTYCQFHAGQYCPPHMTEKRYKTYLADIVRPEAKAAYEEMLAKYEIGPQPKMNNSHTSWLEQMGAM